MQVSVAAVERDVAHIAHHDVLHTDIILPEKEEKKKPETSCAEEEGERSVSMR